MEKNSHQTLEAAIIEAKRQEKEKKRMDCCNICRGTISLDLIKEEARQMGGSVPKNPFWFQEPFTEEQKTKMKELQEKVNNEK